MFPDHLFFAWSGHENSGCLLSVHSFTILINEVISACAGLERKLHYMHSVHNGESIDEAAFQSRPLSEHFITNFVRENHPIFECVILRYHTNHPN